MTRTPVTVSAIDTSTLLTLLIKAEVKSMKEDTTIVNDGYLVSFIGSQEEGGAVFALVKAPTDEAYAVIDSVFTNNVNITNAPVRVFLGDATSSAIDNRQIRLALNELNLLDGVETMVAASPKEVKIWWAESLRFYKDAPMVQAMATALNVTDKDLAGIWDLASKK